VYWFYQTRAVSRTDGERGLHFFSMSCKSHRLKSRVKNIYIYLFKTLGFFCTGRSHSFLDMCFMRRLLCGLLIMLINVDLLLLDGSLAFVHEVNLKIF